MGMRAEANGDDKLGKQKLQILLGITHWHHIRDLYKNYFSDQHLVSLKVFLT